MSISEALTKEALSLQLNLFGTVQLHLNQAKLPLRRAKEQALLAYLAVTRKAHSREILVDLLWSEMAEKQARRNLTATLAGLRKVIPDFLIVDSTSISIDPNAPINVDFLECERLLMEGRRDQEMGKIRQAVEVYQGEFLAGFSVKDAFVFEEWAFAERERIREQVMEGLELLVKDAARWEDWANGIDYANRLLSMEPWRESAHRQLIALHMQAGRRDAAIEQFERCKSILDEELSVEPSAETLALGERLQAVDVAPPHNLPPQPNKFIGRSDELSQIHTHLSDESCRLLTITGPGGIGKTRLALEAARRYSEPKNALAANFTDGIYFVQLAAIPAEDGSLINGMISTIADTLNLSFNEQTNLQGQLNRFLKPKSMLIVCDNVLWGGSVVDPENDQDSTRAIRAFNDRVAADDRVDASMIPVGDGLLLARKR